MWFVDLFWGKNAKIALKWPLKAYFSPKIAKGMNDLTLLGWVPWSIGALVQKGPQNMHNCGHQITFLLNKSKKMPFFEPILLSHPL